MNIQSLRKREGLTQEEIADRIEVSRQSYAKWERGEALPDIANLKRLSDLFGVTLDSMVEDPGPLPVAPRGKHFLGGVCVNDRGQIVIPKKARDLFGIMPGDTLIVLADEDSGIALMKSDRFAEFAKMINSI